MLGQFGQGIDRKERIVQKKRRVTLFKLKSTFDAAVALYVKLGITLWYQLEDMFQLIVMPQGIEKVTIQLIDTPT